MLRYYSLLVRSFSWVLLWIEMSSAKTQVLATLSPILLLHHSLTFCSQAPHSPCSPWGVRPEWASQKWQCWGSWMSTFDSLFPTVGSIDWGQGDGSWCDIMPTLGRGHLVRIWLLLLPLWCTSSLSLWSKEGLSLIPSVLGFFRWYLVYE